MKKAEAKIAVGKESKELKDTEEKQTLTQAEKPEKSLFDNINK